MEATILVVFFFSDFSIHDITIEKNIREYTIAVFYFIFLRKWITCDSK